MLDSTGMAIGGVGGAGCIKGEVVVRGWVGEAGNAIM
jgi:hypothetical protein